MKGAQKMSLTRRSFLQGVVTVPVVTAFVTSIPAGLILEPSKTPIIVDTINKVVSVNEPMSMNVLYSFLKDQWLEEEEEHSFPLTRMTENMYYFNEDWVFSGDDDSRDMIRCSSWEENNDIYTSIIPVGYLFEDQKIKWKSCSGRSGMLESGQAFKVEKDDEFIDITHMGYYQGTIEPERSAEVIYHPFGSQHDLSEIKQPKIINAYDSINGWMSVSDIPQGLLIGTKM